MLSGLIHSHSGIRWILLAALIAAVVTSFGGWKKNQEYGKNSKILHLSVLIITHLQMLLGLVLFFMAWGVKVDFSQMGNSMVRFFTVEHSFTMLAAVVLITLGYSRSKKISESALRFRKIFIFYFIALLLILLGIPWPFRSHLGAGWF
ncbi:MAG: cytochrome B [Spirochaetia bacterium]|nr:cytochrome B [Spirochaetia bacterium]